MKPRQAPVRQASSSGTLPVDTGTIIETSIIEAELMAETPTASPSSPSIRFTALVQSTIQRIVTGTESQPI